jgi:hypothetical protein
VPVQRDPLALEVDRGVDVRVLACGDDRGAHDQRRRRDRQPSAQRQQRGRIDLAVVDDPRHLAPRARQRVRDHPPGAAQRHHFVANRLRSGPLDILPEDPAIRPAAWQLGEVHPQLLSEAPGGGRGERPRGEGLGGWRLGGGRGASRPAGGRSGAVDHHQQRADVHRVPHGGAQLRHHAGRRRGDLDDRLVGLDLHEVLVLGHLVALGHEPLEDLGRRHPLPHVRQAELHAHASNAVRTAASTRSTVGT